MMLGELQLSRDEILQDVSKHGPKEVIITRGSRGICYLLPRFK
ncbi:MAG: hypothetical protein ACOX08_00520 [Methanobacterium sp.]